MGSDNQLLKAIVENLVDGIISIDDHGTIEFFNGAAERIFGYAAADVIGENVKCLMPEPFPDQHDSFLQAYRDGGQAHIIGTRREVQARRKNGETFSLELAVSEADVDG